jgi:glycosyltransferase involved in cell wall biosynthesis
MRIFTGTPCNFDGTQDFFARDSGLTARGFNRIGVESGSITLGPPKPGDLSLMRRASRTELESPDWWGSLALDGLVFYTWGNPLYRRMVLAAMTAGIPVAQVADQQGFISPLADWHAHLTAEKAHYWHHPRWKQIVRTILKLPYTAGARIFLRDLPNARMIATSNLFLTATPSATLRYQRFLRRAGYSRSTAHVQFCPIPVNFHFLHDPHVGKAEEVIAVGRWDSVQKRTPLLMRTIALSLAQRPSILFRIFGRATDELNAWHASLPESLRNQVRLEGLVPNNELVAGYQSARCMLVSAAYEGCHNASAEALCCGTTVVACRSPFLGALEWHAGSSSGTLADSPTAEALSAALLNELAAWDAGRRDPVRISTEWTATMHPDRVAERILELFKQLDPSASR